MHKCEIMICWSAVDNAFIAEAPELPGCMAHRDAHQAALEGAHAAMAFWLDTAAELGRTVSELAGLPAPSRDSPSVSA